MMKLSLSPARSVRRSHAALVALAITSVACKKRRVEEAPAPPASDIAWSANATPFRARAGAVLALRCPPGGVPGTVWGTDLYTDDSSICTAALHSGRVTPQMGGVVQIAIAPGAPAYQGSVRNGVATRNFAQYPGSFTIVGGAAPGLVAMPLPTPTVNPWAGNAVSYRGRNGQSVAVTCAPGGTAGSVWGTDVYSDDSSVCTAAMHAGRVTPAGGAVTIFIRAGQRAYVGSARNGVASRPFGSYPGSFTFDPNIAAELPAPAGTTALAWSASAMQFRGRNGDRVPVWCPPNGTPGTVWGSRTYTDDSSVCTAAVHAGFITLAQGGAFTLRVVPGKRRYRGSEDNGVTTRDFAVFPGSFSLSR